MFGKKNEIAIKMNEIPMISTKEQYMLVEITEDDTINCILAVIPEAGKILADTAGIVSAKELAAKGVYQAILPSGMSLVHSKDMESAFRGFFRNKNGIAGQANFQNVEGSLEKIAQINLANAAIGAASMVVGQYYMKQINTELREVNDSIVKIIDFQKNDYKSRVMALVLQVQRSAKFQRSIIEDANLRNEEILKLQALESDCTELLIKANLEVKDLIKHIDLDFTKYEKKITAPQRIAGIYRHLWGKTGQSAAFGTVGYYGFTTIEETKKRACISSPFSRVFRTFVAAP